MNKIQKFQNTITRQLIQNEIDMNYKFTTPFKEMRKMVKNKLFNKQETIDTLKYVIEVKKNERN